LILQDKHLLQEQIKAMEQQLREQALTIADFNQELNDQKNASAKLRYLSQEAENLVEENQRQLNAKQEELHDQDEKIRRLERKLCKS
jgi:uncharacterized phage infection (PIP) family protein YhgE